MTDDRSKNRREAMQTAYGLLWSMRIDVQDDNLKKATMARKHLLDFLSKDDQMQGIARARWLIGPQGECPRCCGNGQTIGANSGDDIICPDCNGRGLA